MITGQKQGAFSTTPIALTGLSHEIISPRDPASGLPTGKRQHKPIVFTKELDKTSPLLLNALVTNENLTSVLIGLLRNGQPVATIKLTNVSIADYTDNGDPIQDAQRVCGKPRSTDDVAGSGQRNVTTLPRV